MLLAQASRDPTPWMSHQARPMALGEEQNQHEEGDGSTMKSYQERRDSAISLSPPLAYIYGYQHTSIVPKRMFSSSTVAAPTKLSLRPRRLYWISSSRFPILSPRTFTHNAAFDYHPRQPTPSMDQVIATPELLEHILLFLDQRSLLTSCLRVNKTWQSLIDTSPSLQRHLFLRPASPHPLDYHRPPTVNPLLSWGFPNWFDGSRYPERVNVKTGARRRPSDSAVFFDFETNAAEPFYALPWARNPDAWRRKEASWRRMQITQQPIRILHVRAALDTYGERSDLTGTALFFAAESRGCGLRMGELYDYLTKKMENFHFSSTPGDWVCDEGRWEDGDDNSTWTCKSMAEPCRMHEGNWCMQLHIYQPFIVEKASFDGALDQSTFKSQGAKEPFQVFSVEDGQRL